MVRFLLFIYNALGFFIFPLVLLYFYRRSKRILDYRDRLSERFGFVKKNTLYINQQAIDSASKSKDSKKIWLQAVSVGEFMAAVPLLKFILKQNANTIITITTSTPTGSAQVLKFIKENSHYKLHHVYTPLDYLFSVKMFLCAVKPDLVIFMETSIWPNMIRQVKFFSKAKLYLVNSGLSQRSLKKYRSKFLYPLSKHVFECFDQIYVRSKSDYESFQSFNTKNINFNVIGNLKFDFEVPFEQIQFGKVLRDQFFSKNDTVIVAVSTHKGEEVLILQAYQKLLHFFSKNCLKLILIPRHPERFNEVSELIAAANFRVLKFSAIPIMDNTTFIGHRKTLIDFDSSVYLADEIGQMYKYLSMSDLAIVCGSFVSNIGGHNVLEPAMCRLPIIIGEHYFNYKQIIEEMIYHKAVIIDKNNDLFETIRSVFTSKSTFIQYGKNAYQFVLSQQGVVQRVWQDMECR